MSLGRKLRRATAVSRSRIEVKRAAAERRIDAYRCSGDGVQPQAHITITIQVDRGHAPDTIPCPECGGTARSLRRPRAAIRFEPTHELYLPRGPEAKAILDAGGEDADRLRRAELFLRPRRHPLHLKAVANGR
jgi:hypothetical protein